MTSMKFSVLKNLYVYGLLQNFDNDKKGLKLAIHL